MKKMLNILLIVLCFIMLSTPAFSMAYDVNSYHHGYHHDKHDKCTKVPEPLTLTLLGTGIVGIISFKKFFKKKD